MQCPRCQFENMPGQTACFQCGSALAVECADTPTDPPRMPAWKRPIRQCMRTLRMTRIVPHWQPPPGFQRVLAGLVAIPLSIVPGLGHLVLGRLRAGALYIALWAAFILGLAMFYGGFLGMAFLGLAVVMHAWIALHAGLLKDLKLLYCRLVALALLAAAIALIYTAVGRVALADIVSGRVTHPVEFHRVRTGDMVLARRSLARQHPLTRGSLVIAPMSRRSAIVVAQVVALSDETLTVEQLPAGGMCFAVDGRRLDPDKYPVPQWLTRDGLSVKVPPGHCFLSTAYRTRGAYGSADVARTCCLPADWISAKVFMRWLPVWRRGFTREIE